MNNKPNNSSFHSKHDNSIMLRLFLNTLYCSQNRDSRPTFSVNMHEIVKSHIMFLRQISKGKLISVKAGIVSYIKIFPKFARTENIYYKYAHHLHKIRPCLYLEDIVRGQISFNLYEAHKRQLKMYHYILSLEMCHYNSFSDHMINDYWAFLKLARDSKTPVVPTMLIDIVWHAHMDHHTSYICDTKEIVGRILDHDDTIPDEKLEEYRQETERLWQEKYSNNNVAADPGFLYLTYSNCGGFSCSSCTSGCGGCGGCGG